MSGPPRTLVTLSEGGTTATAHRDVLFSMKDGLFVSLTRCVTMTAKVTAVPPQACKRRRNYTFLRV